MTQRVPTEQRSKALQYYYANLEANRAKGRERAKMYYHADRAAKQLKNKEYRLKNPDKWKLIKKINNDKYNKRRFFYVRALGILVRSECQCDTTELCTTLSRAWYKQRGRCAYTGKRLDKKAQVDHKVPLCRGGTNDPENIHWVTADANWVKGTRTHDEFIALCSDVASYIEANRHGK